MQTLRKGEVMEKYSPNKHYNQFLHRMINDYGWRIERTGRSHLKLISSRNNAPVYCSQTPSDFRVINKVLVDLKRADNVFAEMWKANKKRKAT